MNILLINSHSPQINPEKRILLAPLYISAVLKKNNHSVKFLDVEKDKINYGENFDIQNYFEAIVKPLIGDFEPRIVGISVHYSGTFVGAMDIAKLIKKCNSNIIIVMGGHHPTIFCMQIIERYKEIDFILKGESEATILGLIESLGTKKECFGIDGLCYRKNGVAIENDKSKFIQDVDSIPFPDYDLVDIEDYYFDTSKWFNPKNHRINVSFPLLTSRSCPHRCTFCAMYLVQGPTFRMRSAENVVDEIEYFYKNMNQKYFSIVDDNFTLNTKRILDICDLIKKRGLDIQFDTTNGMEINHVTKEIMDALVEAGFLRTFFAIESGSEYIRTKVMKKKLSQETIYQAFDILKEYEGRFDFNVLFVIGLPQETYETLEETRNIIRKLGLRKVGMGFAIPYHGTQLYSEVIQNNLLTIPKEKLLEHPELFNYSEKPFIKPYKLEIEDLTQFRKEVYEEVNIKNRYKTNFASSAKTGII